MPQKAVKCYGVAIEQTEVQTYLNNVEASSLDQLVEQLDAICVFQDQSESNQVFIYRKKDVAVGALVKARTLNLMTAKFCPTLIYVPEADFNREILK